METAWRLPGTKYRLRRPVGTPKDRETSRRSGNGGNVRPSRRASQALGGRTGFDGDNETKVACRGPVSLVKKADLIKCGTYSTCCLISRHAVSRSYSCDFREAPTSRIANRVGSVPGKRITSELVSGSLSLAAALERELSKG